MTVPTSGRALRLGSRKSPMAIAQSRLAAGPLGDHAGHLAGLRDGHRAPAAAQP